MRPSRWAVPTAVSLLALAGLYAGSLSMAQVNTSGVRSITNAVVDGSGNLMVTYSDNPASPVNIGYVVGPAGPSSVSLGTVNISQSAVVAINAGIRAVSVNVPGALMGDSLVAFPAAALPTGYSIENAFVTAPGVVSVTLTAPLLAIGASYTIPVKVVAVGR